MTFKSYRLSVVGQFEFRFLYGPLSFASGSGNKATMSETSQRRIARDFEAEHERLPFNLHEVYSWAVRKDLWYAPNDLAEKKFVTEMADALREEYITTDDGEKVRYYYAVTRGNQGTLWGNLDTAPRDHIDTSLKQRRRQSLGDCRQMKRDMDYVNLKRFSDSPIQLSFNFDADLAEEAAYKALLSATKKAA